MMKNVEIPKWLERLPLAPEFRPTDTEFADPIAYISKIEKEASAFGICKVIPPLAKPSRKYVLHNLNMSLSKCPELGSDVNLVTSSKTDSDGGESSDKTVNSGDTRAVFTTRHQELGCEKGRKVKGAVGDVVFGAQKQVWQSGEVYTLEQFEAKSKNFAKSQLGMMKEVNPLVIEAMFWKASSEKPIYVEYANDVPGSGFGEPERLLRYFDRRRRRRRRKRNSFDRNNLGNADGKSDQVHRLHSIRDNKDSGVQNNLNFCTETTTNYLPPGQLHHHCSSFSGRKDFQGSCDMEGTAGWKLSNSPWNLQVIARSPGSLTRFMPDDIPGVTSPMVYVGMLFSWFAWHVEDHELHSLNFLHMGAPKTWYAVPGDYAFNFEEAIRLHAYGGNADRLVTLSLLGEKTTVLSPEVIVASGIPCCRLVQNPGEFVVTFPRAYHVGFSHGFNCGEAANFGTPKWLTIAKEAAVRRAAMNYLPMLSHQQLLYLLTMSFISRIPRSLLPGVRSSRLRDRQKEERELLVKRAFLEDIMHENRLLTVLLERNSSYHAVLWDAESLPSSNKESEICKDDASTFISTEKASPENEDYIHDVNELGKYISSLDFDLNDDDLAYDFQVESGTLPCVACGILGFPFMAVVQPSEVASFEFMLMDPYSVTVESSLLSEGNHVAEGSTKDAYEAKLNKALHDANEIPLVVGTSQSTDLPIKQSAVPGCSSLLMRDISSKIEISKGWNISNVSLKPRIFCLEHAIEIEKLLSSKGGANVLVICHSDFQKIKTHAAVIAEEISIPFCYTEMSLGDASQEELNVIDVAIDREDMVDLAEDWTSQLSINLQHCVKVKRSSPSKNVQHLLSLGASLCDKTPISNASDMKWLSRKSRSKRHLKHSKGKSSECSQIVKEGVEKNKEHQMAKNDVKIIQYSRKKFKARASAELLAPIDTSNPVVQDILDTYPEDADNKDKSRTRAIPIRVENGKNFSGPSAFASDGKSELLCQRVLLSGRGQFEDTFPSRHEISVSASITMTDNVETETSICVANELTLNDKAGGSCHDSQAHEFTAADGSTQSNEGICSEIVVSTSDKNSIDFAAEGESLREADKMNEFSVTTSTCNRLSENDCELPLRSDGDDLINKTSRHGGASNCSDEESPLRCDEQTEIISGQLVMDGEVSQSPRTEQQQHIPTDGNDQEKAVSGYIALINESDSALIEENLVSDAPVLMVSLDASGKNVFLPDQKVLDDSNSTMEQSKSMAKAGEKRRREVDLQPEGHFLVSGFIRSPCEGLRSRARKDASSSVTDNRRPMDEALTVKKLRKSTDHSVPCKGKRDHQRGRYKCELDGCTMSFQTKAELLLHKSNRCPVDGCRKKFNSHKYAIQHQRVHDDHRPLKCPWNGCAMSFKWAWARTEHLRVHTGERPYVCKVEGCGLTFRFVSDFSRHRRKTGHYVSPSA